MSRMHPAEPPAIAQNKQHNTQAHTPTTTTSLSLTNVRLLSKPDVRVEALAAPAAAATVAAATPQAEGQRQARGGQQQALQAAVLPLTTTPIPTLLQQPCGALAHLYSVTPLKPLCPLGPLCRGR